MGKKRGSMVYIYRHLIGGRSQMTPCEMRMMTRRDISEAVDLHDRVTSRLSHDIFVPTPKSDLERLVGDDGVAVGVWNDNRLICMRAVMTNAGWVNETLADMGLPPDDSSRTVYTDHCIVDKEFRGNNIQFLTHYAIEYSIRGEYGVLYTTVSPKNPFSLANILGCGFVVSDLRELYGGYMRYIMRKKLDFCAPIWTRGHRVIPVSDYKSQKDEIADGSVGYKMIRKQRGYSILYAPQAEHPPRGYWKNMTD